VFRVALVAVPFLLVGTLVSMIEIARMPADYNRTTGDHALAEALINDGLTYGYADFWKAQSVTVISDSEVVLRSVVFSTDGVQPYYYQSAFSWYEDQPGVDEYFILVSSGDLYTYAHSDFCSDLEPSMLRRFTIDSYTVYVYSHNLFE